MECGSGSHLYPRRGVLKTEPYHPLNRKWLEQNGLIRETIVVYLINSIRFIILAVE